MGTQTMMGLDLFLRLSTPFAYGSKLMVMLALPSPISFLAVTLYWPLSSFLKSCKINWHYYYNKHEVGMIG